MSDVQLPPAGVKVIDCIITPSTHLAAFLGTMGCKPQEVLKGPERTQLGYPVTKWVYENDGRAEEIYAMWGKAVAGGGGWETWDQPTKELVVNVLAAFTDNLRHFLTEVKRG